MARPAFNFACTPLGRKIAAMENERINLIGNTLKDLLSRTRELRRYL